MNNGHKPATLSVVIPCYNEEKTLEHCVNKVLQIQDDSLRVEIIIVDDGSKDRSIEIAAGLSERNHAVSFLQHEKNMGKGAALNTGFKKAAGDFVAVQDADLEYDPLDLKKLVVPLVEGDADVVLGSRFLASGAHRVLYYWHSVGNRLLTLFSNMLTDLNLTDMETCYKVFRRDIIQKIDIEENRFGFEPEVIAKIAKMRIRVYEMGISYRGRTYEEGKKIGLKDAFRAVYCILHYNVPSTAWPLQFLIYLMSGLVTFALASLISSGVAVFTGDSFITVVIRNVLTAAGMYIICITLLFRHKVRWNTAVQLFLYVVLWCAVLFIDGFLLGFFRNQAASQWLTVSVSFATIIAISYAGARKIIFPEPPCGDWKPQVSSNNG